MFGRVSGQDFSATRRDVRPDVGEAGFEPVLGSEEGALGEEEQAGSCGGYRDDPTDRREDFELHMSDLSVLWKFDGTRSEHVRSERGVRAGCGGSFDYGGRTRRACMSCG